MRIHKYQNCVYQTFGTDVLVSAVYNIIKFKLRDENAVILIKTHLVDNTEERGRKKRVGARYQRDAS